MDLPEEQKQEYNRMIEDLAAYAKTLDLDVNELTQDAAKFASEMASKSDENSLYPDKPRILREIISFASAVDKEIKRQINNGLYRIELSDMRVDTKETSTTVAFVESIASSTSARQNSYR